MCLTVDKEFKTRQEVRDFFAKPLITKTNKVVYKVLERFGPIYNSPYQNMDYKLGELKTVPKFGVIIGKSLLRNVWDMDIEKGIHACTTLYRARQIVNNGSFRVIVRCYIPKGTPYFIGNYNDIVSLALQMPKKFKHIYL